MSRVRGAVQGERHRPAMLVKLGLALFWMATALAVLLVVAGIYWSRNWPSDPVGLFISFVVVALVVWLMGLICKCELSDEKNARFDLTK